jgi:hypothetical protein
MDDGSNCDGDDGETMRFCMADDTTASDKMNEIHSSLGMNFDFRPNCEMRKSKYSAVT